MAHEILGARFMSRNIPAWHMIGTVVTDVKSAAEGLAIVDNGDPITIDMLPYSVEIPTYGTWMPDNRRAIVRRPTKDDPTPRHFGDVTDQYSLLQNSQLAELMDILIQNTSWGIETVGHLNYGRNIFFTAKDQNVHTVSGDPMALYFSMHDNRNGKDGLELMVGATRIVCQNTCTLARNTANSLITIPHHSDLLLESTWRMEVIAKMINAGNSMIDALNTLVDIPVQEADVMELATLLLPTKNTTRAMDMIAANDSRLVDRANTAIYAMQAQNARNEKGRMAIVENFKYLGGNNGWAAFNAVTEYIDHHSSKDTNNGRRVAAERTLFDSGVQKMRDTAYEYITALS